MDPRTPGPPRPRTVSRAAIAVVRLQPAAGAWLLAHEGHAPLPTRGAQVDVATGQLVLSQEGREAGGWGAFPGEILMLTGASHRADTPARQV